MYRTIDSSFWTDPKVKQLDKDAKFLMLYLVTNQHSHLSGIYYLPRTLLLHETGLCDSDLDGICDTLSGLGLVRFDSKNDVFWVVNMMRYQGRGEKAHRSAANQLRTLHNCLLIEDFLATYRVVNKFFKKRKEDTISDTPSRAGTQKQKQEQEQDKTPPTPPRGESESPSASPTHPETIGVHPLPQPLDTPRFRAAWLKWREHQRGLSGGRSMPFTTVQAQIEQFALWGEGRAVASIENSIRNGYKAPVEQKATGPPNGRGSISREERRRIVGGG